MAKKIIDSIKSAEKNAKETVEEAKKQNQADLESAVINAKKKNQDANAVKLKTVKDAKEKADKDAEKEIEALVADYNRKNENLTKIATKNLNNAVKHIIANI